MNHPTVEPTDVSMETKVNRLARDLKALDIVEYAHPNDFAKNAVVFCQNWRESPIGFHPDVLRVLSEHGAQLLPEQHTDSDEGYAIILLD